MKTHKNVLMCGGWGRAENLERVTREKGHRAYSRILTRKG